MVLALLRHRRCTPFFVSHFGSWATGVCGEPVMQLLSFASVERFSGSWMSLTWSILKPAMVLDGLHTPDWMRMRWVSRNMRYGMVRQGLKSWNIPRTIPTSVLATRP
ncbi:hypothetical protein NCU16615 [Neurospora crassa OR74A]|uniref:Uncharacterized protein n=1 Tax=Neurospora crassa (strain ATCC 24698 / 74-OR23-1A / CBS 708.71 / DSM 1257 / FGSC 987) TaxID=367110 RepID=U9W7Z0_NEUCR|nr:hypothetical protein NCU16615 [Neurospora crassa OR74A]ESA43130.1 hypothetical protein NCU16615 [Neurospora crassa OR74A]|eukprot:XP_011394015.1 hypothetical protein NCU16615 [Neurospora crassa OR74A]